MKNSSLVQAVIVAVRAGVLSGLIAAKLTSKIEVTKVEQTGSAAGSTFQNAKFYAVAADLSSPGSTGTSTSVLNGTTNDLYITDIKIGCEGIGTSKTAYTGTGLSALTLKVSTTSTASPAAVGTNLVNGATITISTSTPFFTLSTSTVGTAGTGSSSYFLVWSAGSYLTFQTNATNTALCTFGANVFSS